MMTNINESQFVSPRQTIEGPSRAAHVFRSTNLKNELSLQKVPIALHVQLNSPAQTAHSQTAHKAYSLPEVQEDRAMFVDRAGRGMLREWTSGG